MHLFKVPLEHSDMIVRGIDLKKNTIIYQIVDKTSGKSMEPIKCDKFTLSGDRIVFDVSRNLHINLANYISETLNS